MAEQPAKTKRRYISVGMKVGAAIALLLLVVSAAVYSALSANERQSLLGAKQQAGEAVVGLFADSVSPAVVFDDTVGVEETLKNLGHNPDVIHSAVYRAGTDGAVGEALGTYQVEGYQAGSLKAHTTQGIEVFWESDRMGVASPVREPGGEVIGHSWTEFSLAKENAAIAAKQTQILGASAVLTLFTIFVILGVTRLVVSAPLGVLLEQVRRLDRGDRVELNNRSSDEVGNLSRAFGVMADSIKAREREIAVRNQDMRLVLDNVEQGFVTLDGAGNMSGERSAIVDSWFGVPEPGMSFATYLGGFDAELAEWFELAWESIVDGFMPLEICVSQLPGSMVVEQQYFRIEYRTVLDGESLRKLIVVISDITAEVQRELAEKANKEFLHVFDRVIKDKSGFKAFFAEASELVRAVETAKVEQRALLLRQIHTLKGNTAIYGIHSIAEYCHDLETRLSESGAMPTVEDCAGLREHWDALEQKLQVLIGADESTHIELDERAYSELLRDLRSGVPSEVLARRVERWRYESTRVRFERLAQQAMALGRRLGKDVQVTVVDNDVRLPGERWSGLWSSLIHVVGNAIDHGIEPADRRSVAGKPEAGSLIFAAEYSASGDLVLSVCDDGAGIDWRAVRNKAAEMNLDHETHEDLVAALFADNMSTRDQVSDTSGRGVGMAAVLYEVRALSGTVSVSSEPGRGTTFYFRFPSDGVETVRTASEAA